MTSAATHAFVEHPHKTLISLSIPVLFSLIAEPLTGLVDTAYVSALGTVPLAALGVGTTALSSVFWVFNFLGIGTQTEVAQALGRGRAGEARRINGLALLLAAAFGLVLLAAGYFLADWLAVLLGASGPVQLEAERYMRLRLLGAPAVLITLTAMGTLRGLQDMRSTFWIATGVNVLNIALDWPLIFGWGLLPGLGVAGAALASSLAQWIGALWATGIVLRRLGLPGRIEPRAAGRLLKVGGDLFFRTGLLMLFLLYATRIATQAGAAEGAAYQVIRQVWIFSAMIMEAFALTGQSLVGFFVGAQDLPQARQVAALTTWWSLGTGVLLAAGMLLGQEPIAAWLVPAAARPVFYPAWRVASLTQPLNALAFNTDGLHWGTGDYRYLRNGMLVATLTGSAALSLVNPSLPGALVSIWLATAVWIGIRSAFGLLRIWPGLGRSPFHLP